MNYSFVVLSLSACLAMGLQLNAQTADPWADHVDEYIPGSGISNDFVDGHPFDNAEVTLGEPTRFTSDADNFGGALTPLQSAFRNDEILSIGRGGRLTVSFDEPVTNDPNNPYGVDLIVFGNSFLIGSTIFNSDFSFNPAGKFDGVAAEGGSIQLSNDGINFTSVMHIAADGLYPTLAYRDIIEPFPTVAGNRPTDYTKPVDPAFDIVGRTYAEVIVGYDGSGGGAGIDIGAVGFESITHVRIVNPIDAPFVPEIDAFADVAPVPEPTTFALALSLAVGGLLSGRCRRSNGDQASGDQR